MAEYNAQEKDSLLRLARESIAYGIIHHTPMPLNLSTYTEHLLQTRACFVTLHLNGQLRGCIGSLMAFNPLVADVVQNAFNAAFKDPRFAPVAAAEVPDLTLDISVLSKPEPLHVASEADLLQKLRPGIDGLILSDKGHQATFLPSVWEQLPNATDFVIHLKNKAGWPSNYWSDTMTVATYTSELIS
ncbi:MAG TPA: AmmeMemoRadiSam system protein A [Gammaproteobacteria bacterium]|nr:AmmeMemoRadiSam system protein A [Gammaproteobacteria bacterium]